MYAPVDIFLPLAMGLVLFFLIERLIGAIVGLFWTDESGLKQAMSQQFIASVCEASANLFFAALYTLIGMVSALLTVMLWASVVLMVGALLYITYEQAPWVWTDMARAYNAFLGPLIQGTVVNAFRLVDVVFKGVVPLWNGFFFFLNRLVGGFFVPFFSGEMPLLGRVGLSFYSFAREMSFSLFYWARSVATSCPVSSGDSCFLLPDRTLDLVTPMAHVRDVVSHFIGIVRGLCDPVTPIFDVVTFPLMDLNFARCVHNLVNSVFYLLVQMPDVTHLRCTRHGAEAELMCTPDLDPFFAFLVAGVRDLGRTLDHWAEIAFFVLKGVLGLVSSDPCASTTLSPPALHAGSLRAALFGVNETVLVGLGGWLMAVTDGVAVMYHGQGSVRTAVWPSPVNVSYGVAAVTYSSASDRDATRLSASAYTSTATALLGCRCVSDGERMQLQCNVLPYEGLLEGRPSLIPVFFQQGDTVERALRCADLDLTVQSVRWPATRYSSAAVQPDCALSRTCNQVDATLWVVPRGDSCGRESTLCACHPFCMATRLAGSQTSPLVLYSADQWRSKVYVIRRNCALANVDALTVSNAVGRSVVTTSTTGAAMALEERSAQFVSSNDTSTIECEDNLLVTSLINRTRHPAYTSPTPAFLRSADAPFAIAGDTILTSVRRGDGGYTVRVERLTGFTGSEFTLSLVTDRLPSYPPVDVPADLFKQYPKDHVTIPYARQATLAVSSRNYVFFAVNPSVHVYDAYLAYCRSGASLPFFGLIMASSFSPIRIWRVEAYRRCGPAGCGADLVRQADIPDAFSQDGLTRDCARVYNEGATHLEYVNEANLAVTVRRGAVNGSVIEYRTYWLHIPTMRVGDSPWQDEAYQTSTALSAYALCPSMQVLPDGGTLMAELLSAGIFLLKMPIDLVVYLPGITSQWRSGSVCPLVSRGHSILQQCGSELFSLDDFFDSLQTATNVFWSSLSLLSGAIGDLTPDTDASRFVQNILEGTARYGAGSIDLWAARFQILRVMEAGPKATLQSLPTNALLGAEDSVRWVQGGFTVSASTLSTARFGYTCLAKIVVVITQNVLLNREVSPGRVWRIIVNTLDEMRVAYDGTIVESMRQSCAGIALMLGLTNPWAVFIHKQCVAANTALSAGLDVVLSIFSLAPFAQCMCSGSAGKVFGDYARDNCVPQASARLRPVLVRMIQASSARLGLASDLCDRMLDYTKAELLDSVQPWFDAQFASMDALAASADYALSWFDSDAGRCLNYEEDPDVVVIMPHPSEYFQACGSTSLCRARCAGPWNAFDAALAASSVRNTTRQVQVVVESLFFPGLTVDAFTPMRIRALLQSPSCDRVCDPRPGDSCLAVAGVAGNDGLAVQHYCVPLMTTASVYRTRDTSVEWLVEESASWTHALLKLQFADAIGSSLVALTTKGEVWLCTPLGCRQITTKESLSAALGLRIVSVTDLIIMIRPPYASVHVGALYRLADGRITAEPLHVRTVLDPTQALPPVWINMGHSFLSAVHGYVASQATPFSPASTFLLLPTIAGLPVAVLTARWDASDIANGVVGWEVFVLPDMAGVASVLLEDGQALSQNCHVDAEGAYIAFLSAPPTQSMGWLQQARVSGAAAAVYPSQPAALSVQTTRECGIKSCAGCPDGEVQRLCDAVQRCSVINCIGTPVNMRRVLCQLGQRIADDSRENLALVHGGWLIFVDMFMLSMDLSLRSGQTSVALEWPDDRFFGYICTVKDQGAHFISIFTSAINSVLLFGHSAVSYFEGGAHNIDRNFYAMSTLPMTALTSFLHQVWMAPVYGLIVAQKTLMCRVQGVMALLDATGFRVIIGSAEFQAASTSLVGRCLTMGAEAELANSAEGGDVGSVVAGVVRSAALALIPELSFGGNSLETIMHTIDGGLSYMMGVLMGLSDFLASVDMARCSMPDHFLNETVFCACDDASFSIADARRTEGLYGAGFWCTGTLSMLDASNNPFVIYNPYTYAQLQELASSGDRYLACMAGGGRAACEPLLAKVPEFQGVSVLTVLTACKSNYMHSQWDKAAFVLFNRSAYAQELGGEPPDLSALPLAVRNVGTCLADPATRPACLQEYMASRGVDPQVYWSYEELHPTPTDSRRVDACQVFTGPARNPDIGPEKRSLFRACLDQYADSDCQLSSSLWTPQSDNAVPVAHRHAVRVVSALDSVVELKYQEAHDLILRALEPLRDYDNPELRTIFFSPEGDIMHQMMDCVFMGPYAKVDYWPPDALGLLPVPSWHRDANGTSRALDTRECVRKSMDRSPPYSCGSHARQAVIKYFFRDYLPRRQNSTMNAIINRLVADVRAAWGNVTAYQCLCADNRTHATACCLVDGPDSWLPPNLRPTYQALPSGAVLREIAVQLQTFHRLALEDTEVWTKYLPPETLAAYNWSADPGSAEIVREQAHFRTDAPIVGYAASEARSPFHTTALWHQCHGLLSQIFFTIPMRQSASDWIPDWIPHWPPAWVPGQAQDGLQRLDSFIRSAVGRAFAESPLYRHYNVSYVPSDSRMCRKRGPFFAASGWPRRLMVSSYSSPDGAPLFDASGFPRPLAHGPDAFPMSDRSSPFHALSDYGGVLDATEMDDWLLGVRRDYTIQGYDLLRRGRAGLRVVNFEDIAKFDNITKFEDFAAGDDNRLGNMLPRAISPDDASLPYCASDLIGSSSILNSESELRNITRALFPVSQGVYESSTTAYCLRYAVEMALLTALELAGTEQAIASQRMVSDLWRGRCESQIALLSLCKALDVFRPPVEFRHRVYPCPFSVSLLDGSDVYMTPGCLVHAGGVFYDPCNCPGFACGPSKPAFGRFIPACRIPFDPRNMSTAQLGGWRVSPLEAFDREGFVESVLSAGDGLGNVRRGEEWAKAEGSLKDTGRHCDMMADWWPEAETLPVGYHATTSCSSDDTGYRTFDSAFAVERTAAPGQFTVVRLVYQNDLTRQADTVDSTAGSGGVCRASNVGAPLVRTNRVRLCTRTMAKDDTALDPAVPTPAPLYASPLPDSAFSGPERCSSDGASPPWFGAMETHDSALHSFGTVPNMPDPGATTYPQNSRRSMSVGSRDAILSNASSGGWGEGCSDFALRECANDGECPFGFFCHSSRVCLHADFRPENAARCLRHDECPFGLMCDGQGRCVQGHIHYLNDLQEMRPIEASVFSERCDEVNSAPYRTDGASPWEYVPDWLEGHGMCSNKNWYMYSLSLQEVTRCASTSCTGTACQFNARECALSLNRSAWWPPLSAEPAAFAVKPTVCDRDYEHLNGPTGARMVGCTPRLGVVENRITDVDNARQDGIEYARLFRNFDSDGTAFLGQMPLRSEQRTGFLGLPERNVSAPSTLINCERYQNCYAHPFTFNGATVPRRRGDDSLYDENDIFRCGASAFYDPSKARCRLDTRAMRLYAALCTPGAPAFDRCTCNRQEADLIGCRPTVNRPLLESICANVLVDFTASFATIRTNTEHLQALFNVFEQTDGSLRAQVSGVECFEAIHTSMQAAAYGEPAMGLQYPFTFALHEIPLAWMYQCAHVGGVRVSSEAVQIPCRQFEASKNLSDVRGGQGFSFNFVRAGYRRAEVLRRIHAFYDTVRAGLPVPVTVSELQASCPLQGAACDLVPYCASRRDWVRNADMQEHTRRFIAGIYQFGCITAVRDSVLAERQMTFEEYVLNHTILTGFAADDFMRRENIPTILSLIETAVVSCVEEQYRPSSMWPLVLSFPESREELQTCFRQSLPGVLNNLTLHLIRTGHPYSNVDRAYMPSENIRDQKFPRPGRFPDACIFPNLNAQERLFSPSRVSAVNGPFDASGRFNGVNCRRYPLSYMLGTQACRYPLPNSYTSLSALLMQVWDLMSSRFFASFRMPSQNVQPSELSFWQMGERFDGWSYDTTALRRYLSNINPDTTKEVMCVIAGTSVDFTACNDANYATLRDFTESRRQTGAPIIPPGRQLTWRASREFLSRGGIFAFAAADRGRERVLLRNLFDDSLRCGAGEQMYNRVCLLSGQTVRPWVPWMAGEWNPYEMCDVRAMDLNHGNLEVIWPFDTSTCKQCSDPTGQYRRDFMFDPNNCEALSNTYARFVNVESDAPTNLCRVRMRDSERSCSHPMGMAGGGRGQSVLNHPRVSHIYGTHNLSEWPTRGGLYPRGEPILRGIDAVDDDKYGFLSIPGDELGATAVGLVAESLPGGAPYLRVSHVPLTRQEGYMKRWASRERWPLELDAAFEEEDRAFQRDVSGGSAAWDCPARRAAYYGGGVDGFSAPVPNQGRARRLFGHLTGGLHAHPTQALHRGASGLGNYTTSNGVCYCPAGMPSEQTQCLVPLSDRAHPCSLSRTIQALRGSWVQSHAFTPRSTGGGDSPCAMQFDWPYARGPLRDGTNASGDYTWASDPAGKRCHLLDRLPPFQHRYKSDLPPEPIPGRFTTDQGGVCHTGRAATLTPQAAAVVKSTRCVKRSETNASIDVTCEDGTRLTLSKERSTPLPELVKAVRSARMACGGCSPPPEFVNSRRERIPAESSFGIPFRFSASRMASSDLRGLLCGGASPCAVSFNESAWKAGEFMRALLTAPSSLFLASRAAPPAGTLDPPPAWPTGKGWVFCNSSDALRSGACEGEIAEAAWHRDRFRTCYKSVEDASRGADGAIAPVDVCLIDANLQDLCVAVDRAQSLVREANCLASGSPTCALKPFLYQPATWDVSNREFVHSSVRRFYRRVAPQACPDRVAAIRENNQALRNRCAATPVSAMYIALQACRSIVDTLADVLFYMLNLVINGLRLVMDMSQARAGLIAQTVYYWEQIVLRVRNLLAVLSDLFFEMLFNMGSLGTRLYRLMRTSCGYINAAYRYWMQVWCSIALDFLPAVLGGVRSVVEMCETGFGVLNDSLDSIFTAIVPSALSTMYSKGYDTNFRDRKANQQARERQTISDSAKRSKREGRKADIALTLAYAGTAGAAGLGAAEILKQVALTVVGSTRFGFIADLAQGIANAVEMQRLMSLYPSNWTLFDFRFVYVALDVFELYITSDEQCLARREANVTDVDVLNCSLPPLASKDSLAGAARVGTRCWADAQRDVGTSNLLACTESDTCYLSDYDRGTPIVCGSCPDAGPGFSPYGCSALTKMCTCSVPVTRASACSSNSECAAFAVTTCQLITSLDDMSYGNQPCADCSKDVQCLMRSGSGLGRCGCMFQAQPVQRCMQMPGQFVPMTDGSRICGYLPGADRSTPLTAVLWESLAMIRCSYLKAARIYCARVFRDGVPMSLAVGIEMASLQQSFQSRRLLVDGGMLPDGPFEVHRAESEYALPESDEGHALLLDDWNGTAEPCSSLAHAYQQAHRTGQRLQLGPTDTTRMHSCAYWRLVGRRTIERFGLRSLKGNDGFLLSADDFASALAQRWVLLELLSTPGALLFAAGHSPLLKPLYAAALTLRSLALSWGRKHLQEVAARPRFASLANLTEGLLNGKLDADEQWAEEESAGHFNSSDSGLRDAPPAAGAPPARPGRHLLQSSTDLRFAETWLAGPFTWPPPFYKRLTSQCNLATAIVEIAHDIISALSVYYYGSFQTAPNPPRGIWDNLPNLTCSTDLRPAPRSDGLVSSVYHFIWGLTGIDPGYVRGFFSNGPSFNLFTLTTSMLKCDFRVVTYCSGHRKDLLASIVIVGMMFGAMYYIAGMMGMSLLVMGLILVLGFVPTVLWYSYGMAFTCAPMLPTCLLEDVVSLADALFPAKINFPSDLLVSPGCLDDPSQDACLIRCSEPPVRFVEWRDTLAFGLCYASPYLCERLSGLIGERDALSWKLQESLSLVRGGSQSSLNASLFCFGITFVNVLPVIILLVIAATVAAYLVYVPCTFAPKLVGLVGQYLVYLHTKSDEDKDRF